MQESHAGRPVKLVRTVSVLRGCNALHALPEFIGWGADPSDGTLDKEAGRETGETGVKGIKGGTAHVRPAQTLLTRVSSPPCCTPVTPHQPPCLKGLIGSSHAGATISDTVGRPKHSPCSERARHPGAQPTAPTQGTAQRH